MSYTLKDEFKKDPGALNGGAVACAEIDVEKNNNEEKSDKEKDDPWKIVLKDDDGPKWSELSGSKKVKQTSLIIIKVLFVFGFLYLFFCALGFLSDAFKLVGGKVAGQAFQQNKILSNPVAGLMLGVLATVLLQSSSTTTSIIITMAGAKIIPVKSAIPMIMGANIGTSVTNTIVSLAQSADREEFRKAFGGATVHDMFNWLSVIILLPIEIATHYLYYLTGAIVDSLHLQSADHDRDMLKAITSPFTKLIIQINKDIIYDIAVNKEGAEEGSILKRWCKNKHVPMNVTQEVKETFPLNHYNQTELAELRAHGVPYILGNTTDGLNSSLFYNETVESFTVVNLERCGNLFAQTDLSDHAAGFVMLAISLVMIVSLLIGIVKMLNSLLKGSVSRVVKKVINAQFPGKFAYFTGYVAILIGTGMTMVLQSSSIFTSILTPLVGVGVVSLDRMFPLTLGANIGTTLTGILAALAQDNDSIGVALHVAFCHLFFNITGTILFFPIPITRKAPINLAKILGNTTAKYRWFSIVYLIVMFFVLPGIVFALSLAGDVVMMAVGIPLLVFLVSIVVINICQAKCKGCLPKVLQTWDFLPLCCHSLRPIDNVISKLCCCKKKDSNDDIEMTGKTNQGFDDIS